MSDPWILRHHQSRLDLLTEAFSAFTGLATQDGFEGNKPHFCPLGFGSGNPGQALRIKSDQGSLSCQEPW